MIRATHEPAYVLHGRPYRDTSLIVEALTEGHGRVPLVARGARRPRSALHGVLQPFAPLLLSWSARGDLGTLRAAERGADAPGGGLAGRALLNGLYCNELLLRLLHRHDPHREIFHAYGAVLRRLAQAQNGADEERALRVFEKHLLRELGYGLVLDHDAASGAPIQADVLYTYDPERGPIAGACGAPGVAIHGRALRALECEVLDDAASLREVKRLMRIALAARLDYRPLNSRRLFERPAQAVAP